MFSNQVKRYLEEMVKEQYQEINSKDSNHLQLRNKIGYLDKLLTIGATNPVHQTAIQTMVEELERVAIHEGMISFPAVANLNLILSLMLEVQNKTFDEEDKVQIFRVLKIISNSEILQNVFPQNTEDTFEQMRRAEEYLNQIKRKDLIPYIKAWYLSSNPLETNQMPIYTYWNYVGNLFLAYIELAYKVRDYVMELYCKEKIHLDCYLREIIQRYEEKVNFKYIPSSVIALEEAIGVQEIAETEEEPEEYVPFIEINQDENLKKVKLIGYAGAGKTTTLEYIAYQDALSYAEKRKNSSYLKSNYGRTKRNHSRFNC